MKRMLVAAVALSLALSLALAGCSSPVATRVPQFTPTPKATTVSTGPSALGLNGLWRVTGAAGEGPTTWLRLDGEDLIVWDRCAVWFGDWRGSDGLFVSTIDGYTNPTCDLSTGPEAAHLGPGWLSSVAGFARAGAGGWQLTDAGGATVAHLAVDGHPPTSGKYSADLTQAPALSDAEKAAFAEPRPLPAGVLPVARLTGKWIPLVPVANDSYASFHSGGAFSGTDGCNGTNGRWISGPDGLLLVATGLNGLVGCAGSPLVYWATGASRVGMVGSRLTFFDASGRVLGQAIHS
jgi:hypothetical protein